MRVVLGEAEVVTAYGWGMEALWDGLMSGKTAIGAMGRIGGREFGGAMAGVVPGLEVAAGESRVMAMLRRVLGPLAGKVDAEMAVILATTVGEIEYLERGILEGCAGRRGDASPEVLLGRIKEMLGLRGTGVVISSACASSAAALGRGAAMIRAGEAKRVLLVACDGVSEFVHSGFASLLSLCEGAARPFDAGRTGLTLGEAAAWVVLSAEGEEAGDECCVLGWGSSTDAYHMTAPDPGGRGLSRAIAKACAMAGRDAGEISLIAAHGTATVVNDAMEMLAFRAAIRKAVPVFSVKGAIGHTLGAAGLLQILVARRAMVAGVVPPTVGLRVADAAAEGWAAGRGVVLGEGGRRLALSTNSGFGGVNTAVLLEGGR